MKKKSIITALFLATIWFGQAQQLSQKVGTNPTVIQPSAALEVDSTTKGFLPPRMSFDQRNAIVSPIAGLQVWCTDCGVNGELQLFNGNSWTNCIGSAASPPVVISSTGRIWMDRNLGASRKAQSSNDYLAYGSSFQWGRKADGHELVQWTSATSGTRIANPTTIMSSTNSPSSSHFIITTNIPYDWRSPQNNSLWQGLSGINNPCPAGFRIPTNSEFISEFQAYNITNSLSAFNSPLKLTAAGFFNSVTYSFGDIGLTGCYYTSSTIDTNANYLYVTSNNATTISSATNRGSGMSVRCIKD